MEKKECQLVFVFGVAGENAQIENFQSGSLVENGISQSNQTNSQSI